MANKSPITEGMLKYSKEKSILANEKVNETIKKMIKNKETINFNSVSIEANVSKSFIYKNKGLRNRIETLRSQQANLSSPKAVKRNMTENSKDILIDSLRRRIKIIEQENRNLKEKLKIKYGEIYVKV
jgi:hypothetical protein